MASIKIQNIQPAGFDLLDDSESYLSSLTKEEMNIHGGAFFLSRILPRWLATFYPSFMR